ncbi:DUF3813 domain-containing protein [Rossellomorea marisflavi]|uniref:DUF3813 domain-containing protein n=1 Tax=Rossellomorea marisflavi TaxID=189381 RepID=UPI00064F301A|nr:DUF3813 domain-containing protein [Rossellomorea marisflavi]KMK96808.1 hypothetical protein VL03_04240 [Rossellomorea marisflavi]KML33204.1 hypothetical protein VL12_11995 [Rossellomorea marisflavi]MCM2603816.1 DUF3813 domain-containing protein [Rossellomorea marisflavi]TYO72014.1 DUF3813 domain-containing protein [Rossellomorea marisflavi]USK93782.1 DUF3813 domain-containing protein [Rossellomorea marisflavi]
MANPLFRQARTAVEEACGSQSDPQAIQKAKNALSSAFANSNNEEKKQLHSMQDELDRLS